MFNLPVPIAFRFCTIPGTNLCWPPRKPKSKNAPLLQCPFYRTLEISSSGLSNALFNGAPEKAIGTHRGRNSNILFSGQPSDHLPVSRTWEIWRFFFFFIVVIIIGSLRRCSCKGVRSFLSEHPLTENRRLLVLSSCKRMKNRLKWRILQSRNKTEIKWKFKITATTFLCSCI